MCGRCRDQGSCQLGVDRQDRRRGDWCSEGGIDRGLRAGWGTRGHASLPHDGLDPGTVDRGTRNARCATPTRGREEGRDCHRSITGRTIPRRHALMVEDSRAELAPPSRETMTDEDADSSRWPPVSYWARVTVVVLLVVVGFGLLWILRGVALVLVASLVL